MKLIFSCLLLFSLHIQNVGAREIIVIEHIENGEIAKIVKKILINKFHFPDLLIKINFRSNTCSENKDAILQLCVFKNGEVEIKNMNKYVLKSAFNIFLDKKE